jgi:hypothetical protein
VTIVQPDRLRVRDLRSRVRQHPQGLGVVLSSICLLVFGIGCGQTQAKPSNQPNAQPSPLEPATQVGDGKSPWVMTSTDEIASAVDLVLKGRVVDVRWSGSAGDEDDPITLRQSTVKIEQVYRGDADVASNIDIAQIGLQTNGTTVTDPGTRFLMPGDAGYFFVVTLDGQSWLAGQNGFYELDGRPMTDSSPRLFKAESSEAEISKELEQSTIAAKDQETVYPWQQGDIRDKQALSRTQLPSMPEGNSKVSLETYPDGYCLTAPELAPVCTQTGNIRARLEVDAYPIPGWSAWLVLTSSKLEEAEINFADGSTTTVPLVAIADHGRAGILWSTDIPNESALAANEEPTP